MIDSFAKKIEQDQRNEYLIKLLKFCNYRERCTSELKQKMYDLRIPRDWQEDFLEDLEEDNMINDQRYAINFAESKHRLKYWGKNKIKMELLTKKIKSSYIEKALRNLNEKAYLESAKNLIEKKLRGLKADVTFEEKNAKVYRFLYYKGYEPELIRHCMQEVFQD